MPNHPRLSIVGAAACAVFAFLPSILAETKPAIPPLLPVESFAKLPTSRHPVISWDGKTLVYKAVYDRDEALVFKNLATGKLLGIEAAPGRSAGSPLWVNQDRVIYGYMAGVDRTGDNSVGLLGQMREDEKKDQQRLIARNPFFTRFKGSDAGSFLMYEFDHPSSYGRYSLVAINYPNVIQMNSRTGAFQRIIENPGKVTGWMADGVGVVKIGVEFDENTGLSRIIYRPDQKSAWRELPGLGFSKRKIEPVWLSYDGKLLYLSMLTPTNTWGIYTYDIAQQKIGELILSHDKYDIIPDSGSLSEDGFGLQTMVTTPEGELLGVRFVTDKPRVVWFNPQMAGIQAALDKALPGKINTIVSMSDALKKFVILSWSDRDPGTYYVFDMEKGDLQAQFPCMPWIKSEQMAPVYPVSYTARDGLVIRGYLTVPLGREAKNLPLVVMPHGGPFVRDSWSFDPEVQFLANRGYAVLQMNYRGSPGYGQEFYEKGMRKIGTDMQNDITDGTRWAIQKGIADPKRIAIMGGSFGGYSALMGLILAPELYRCGICYAGVTDWTALLKYDQEIGSAWAKGWSADHYGDPIKDNAMLASISPTHMADKINAPLLMIYSKDDPTVPFEQARLMTDALDKAGKKYEYFSKFNEGHGFYDLDHRITMMARVEQFLAKNMPADPVPAVAAK